MRRFTCFFILWLSLLLPLFGYGQPGISDFYQASSEVRHWYFALSDLVLVLGAIAGLIGGLRVYTNWQSGRHHIDAQVMAWFFSCLFLALVGTFLKGLFGL
ncbi:plasmid transfer protein [Sphingobacteriaceae bacterium GW460-11-11-14-LB5]|nr:plasmid transfer protein [Sphingobacteriaceae bacterium GW460-11-11-14-LB5]